MKLTHLLCQLKQNAYSKMLQISHLEDLHLTRNTSINFLAASMVKNLSTLTELKKLTLQQAIILTLWRLQYKDTDLFILHYLAIWLTPLTSNPLLVSLTLVVTMLNLLLLLICKMVQVVFRNVQIFQLNTNKTVKILYTKLNEASIWAKHKQVYKRSKKLVKFCMTLVLRISRYVFLRKIDRRFWRLKSNLKSTRLSKTNIKKLAVGKDLWKQRGDTE